MTTIAVSPNTAVARRATARGRACAVFIEQMTLREKLAQLYDVWVGASGYGGDIAPTEVVQLYLHDPVGSVNRLVSFARVDLEPGRIATVAFTVPTDLASFTGSDGTRMVEPGELQLRLAASSQDVRFTAVAQLVGPVKIVDYTRDFHADVSITR